MTTAPTNGFIADLSGILDSAISAFGLEPDLVLRYLVRLLIIWGVALLVYQVVKAAARRIAAAADDGVATSVSWREKRASTIGGMLKGVGGIAILVIAAILTLDIFMNIGPILAGAGVLGLAISFGSQSLVKDVIAGFFILVENQFDVGDVVEVAGIGGGVERMSLRVTQLRDIEGTLHFIPNGQITTVSNKTRQWARRVLDIRIGYGEQVDRAIRILEDEATSFGLEPEWRRRMDGDPEVVGVNDLSDSSVAIRVMFRTHPGDQWAVGREFMRRAKNRLDIESIEGPFPKRTVHLMQAGEYLGPSQDSSDAVDRAPPKHAARRSGSDGHVSDSDN